jgi:ribosomal protein S18 acetylase RimI-like enzyme
MNDEIIIRKAIPSDSLRLSVLYKQVYIQTYGNEGVSNEYANFITKQFAVEKIENTINSHPDNISVAEYKGNLVGVAEVEFDKQCPVDDIIAPELNKLYILEWFCGMGIGQKLLEAAEETVRSKGINEIWLWVYLFNRRAISFYEKQQYQWIGNAFFQMEFNKYENKVMLKKL